ncbi:hypothetical protein BGZ98_002117 [Dissophora globulifera]|nr:hypothetical protein BGZ98_002117 [Dissophora globulifera]
MVGTASASTPSSGMHSPPLSNTVEEETIESTSAATAAATKLTALRRDASPAAAAVSFSSGTALLSVTPSLDRVSSSSTAATSSHGASPGELDALKTEDLRQLQLHQSKERTIEHVLKQGKILKVSRRLRTRLEYAILKIRRGWSKYTLQEVESLIQPACSPRVTAKQIHKTLSRQSSPRQSERKRVVKTFPAYETTTYTRGSSDPLSIEVERDNDVEMTYHPSAPSTPTGRYRSRMPSLSQYKDSELFQPAKSLMDIATSKPEPGYMSPYLQSGDQSPFQRHATPEPLYRDATPIRDTYSMARGRWSGMSTPAAPSTPVQHSVVAFEDEDQEESAAPSATQAARTILMLSSPTRPPPRALNQNYIFEMHSGNPTHSPIGEWTAPYSPTTSSPLVQFHTNASSTPSPDQTPSISRQSAPEYTDEDRSILAPLQHKESSYHTPKALKQPYSNLYGMGHEPSSPSPLSTALFPSHNEPLDRIKSFSRSSSPTLKRAVRFAAAATNASESRLSAESAKDRMSGMAGRMEYEGAADMYTGSPSGYEDRKESAYRSGSPLIMEHHGESYSSSYDNRPSTPPPSSSTYSASYGGSSGPPMVTHGMRTPPPSGGKDFDLTHYSLSASAPRRRRGSGMEPPGSTDLSAMFHQSASPNASSPHAGTSSQ